ncbi:DUF443 family protein [Virgibacillus sp. FSP13]
MDCEVQYLNKNMRLRYKLLIINGENYIIDVDKPFWIYLFPFAYWFLPNTVFRIDDEKTLEQIKVPKVKQIKTSYFSALGTGISLILANLLTPLMDFFNIETSTILNCLILFFFTVLVILFRFFLSKINGKNLYKIVNTDQLQIDKLWIRPKSIKYFFQYLIGYLSFLIFAVLTIWMFIDHGNVMMLLFSMFLLFCLLLANILTMVPGTTKVKFKKKQHVV